MTWVNMIPYFIWRILNCSNFQWVEITFPKRKINPHPSFNFYNNKKSSCVSTCLANEVLKYCLVLVCPCVFLDASTEGYEEQEEIYEEEEEGQCTNCANCTNQGKLIPMQAILVQVSKAPLQFIYLGHLTNPKFILQAFIYFSKVFL